MNALEEYLEELAIKVCRDLATMYANEKQPSSYGLIFPRKRDGSLRISEQEAKLLFVQHLTVDKRYCFCVETPTAETYTQKGTTPMSARVDVTLIGSDRTPIAHVEQKAHNCEIESIRKDLEKLLREKATGCWFHTLERADSGTLRSLFAKFRTAFARVTEHVAQSQSSYLFVIFVLQNACLSYRWLHFSGDKHKNESMLDTAFTDATANSGWHVSYLRGDVDAHVDWKDQPVSNAGKGLRTGYLVFAPTLCPESFLHLSVRGGSYRLRQYALNKPGAAPKAFVAKGYHNFESLRDSGVLTEMIPVTSEDLQHNIETDLQYWCERIRKLNRQQLLVAST